MRVVTRDMRRQLERDNAKRPPILTQIPSDKRPSGVDATRIEVWRSREFLVQVFIEEDGVQRISMNRTTARLDGRWDDALTWDEIQEIKRQIGRADNYAIEVYPRDRDVVNVANMRHLWVLPVPLSIGWFKQKEVQQLISFSTTTKKE